METNNSSYVPSRVKGIIFAGILWSIMLNDDKFVYIQTTLLILSAIAFLVLCWSINRKGGVSEDGLKESRKDIEYYGSALLVFIGAGIGVAIIDIKSDWIISIVLNTIILAVLGFMSVYSDLRKEK
jgi:hypothetical protein